MKKSTFYGITLVLGLMLFAQAIQAQISIYTASLSGAAESPPVASAGTGTVTVTIDGTLNTMRVQCTFSGLTGTTTASHIHAATAVANTGTAGVATQTPSFTGFPLGVTSGSCDQTYNMTLASSYNPAFITANGGTAAAAFAALKAALDANKAYFNIHTSTFTGGEIRGFLTNTCFSSGIAYVNASVASSGDGTTWATAFKTLQEALTAANSCPNVTQIWVAKGTYYPDEGGSFANNDRNAAFTMKNGVAIYGGFVGNEASDYDLSLRNFVTNETILSGDIDKDNTADADNAYHVIFNNFTSGTPLTSSAVLDGFTITDGYANGSAPNSNGAGMYNNYASPIVRHCTFTRNTIVGICYGGGMYNSNSSPNVSDCTFSDNNGKSLTSSLRSYGIGMYNDASSPTITNCTFTNNTAEDKDYSYGGGIYNTNSSPVISECSFSDNTTTFGPGIFNRNSPLNISNCTFTNNQIYSYPGGVNGSGINTAGSTGTITNCRFINNGGVGSIGIEDGALVEIARCSFSVNRYGIALSEASPNISNCLFTGNGFGGVVVWYGASTPVITNCTFSENPGSGLGSISNYGDNSPILKNCIIWGSGNSVYVQGSKPLPTITYSIVKQASGVYTGTGNLNVDPLFVNAADPDGADNQWMTADDGLRLSVCSPAVNAGTNTGAPTTDIVGNTRPLTVANPADMGAYEFQGSLPTTLYVNQAVAASGDGTSWATAFKTLQEALQLSCPSVTQIWVAKGTYYPDEGGSFANNDRAASFTMKNGVGIYGGFSGNGNETMLSERDWTTNPTILSGEIQQDNNASNNSYHVFFHFNNNLTSTAVLDGFTITGGNANSGSFSGNVGGGIMNYFSSPSLTNIIFSGNGASLGGGLFNHRSFPSLSKVTFTGNSAATQGGGIFNENSSAPSLSNVIFSGNSATTNGGGMSSIGGSPSLTNCSFLGNVANGDGGGMYNSFSSPILTNCTFSGNQATLGGGMYNVNNSSPSFKNSILWGNSTEVFNEPNNDFPSNPTYTNTLVQGLNPAGTGNLDGTNAANNPLFVNQPPIGLGTTGNLRLQPCSPAIDAGTSTGVPTTDILGNARVDAIAGGNIVDMGAYEYQGVLQEINLQGGSPLTNIPDGDNSPTTAKGTDFGNVNVSSNVVKTFTIQNTGGSVLGVNSINSNNGRFTISGITPPTTIMANGSTTFTVTFTPTAVGTQNATITLNNDDCDAATYDFAVTGNGFCPDLTAAAPAAQVTNSTCGAGCVVGGGSIAAPSGTCPAGSTLQYSTNGGMSWSTTLPTYAQTGPPQTIKTRCLCDGDPTQFSPESSVTTVPGTVPALNIPTNGAATVACPALATQPTPPVVNSCNGSPITPSGPVVTNNPNPLTCEGTRTYTYTYICGQSSATWSFVYTIERQPFTVPTDGGATVACLAQATTPTPPTVLSNCGEVLTPSPAIITDSPTSLTCEGTRTYAYAFTDCEGNTAVWSFVYTIERQPFTISTPNGAATVYNPALATPPTPPVVLSNCGETLTPSAPVITNTPNPLLCEGTRTYAYTYTDCEGNTATWSFVYTVIDNIPPQISCPANLTVCQSTMVTYTPPVGTDNCIGAATLQIAGLPSGSVFPVGVTTNTFQVTATNNQTATCSFTVTVNPLPTANISGTVEVCQNAPFPSITFTGSNGTAPYTFTYKINGGADLTITTSGNSVSLNQTTAAAGTFVYSLLSVKDASSTQCSQSQSGSATITVNPLPVLTFTGPNPVCQGLNSALSANLPGAWTANDPSKATINPDGTINALTPGTATFTFTVAGTGCQATTSPLTIKPTPTSALTASKYDVCPNTPVTLNPNCSIPTSTVQWNPGAPTVTPDAATIPYYVYKASCTADGCTGNESSVEVRTHRILVDMKDLDVGALPLPIVRPVIDNMTPTNQVNAPVFPRRWTFIANGCEASESAVFKLSGPVNFSAIDNAGVYAMFANDSPGGNLFYSIDHPNYGNGGSFPNGTYTLTIDLRSQDGVGGPFPKNRVAVGSLLATRTLQFTVGNPLSALSGRQSAVEADLFAAGSGQWAVVIPNPVSNIMRLKVTDAKGQNVSVSLLDASGRTMLKRDFMPEANQHQEEFEVGEITNGMYFLKVNTPDKNATLKVVKVE